MSKAVLCFVSRKVQSSKFKVEASFGNSAKFVGGPMFPEELFRKVINEPNA